MRSKMKTIIANRRSGQPTGEGRLIAAHNCSELYENPVYHCPVD